MSVGIAVLNGIIRTFFPRTGLLIFYIACTFFVKLCLAYIMQKAADCKAFFANRVDGKVLFHHNSIGWKSRNSDGMGDDYRS